jgi:hypothetical protein
VIKFCKIRTDIVRAMLTFTYRVHSKSVPWGDRFIEENYKVLVNTDYKRYDIDLDRSDPSGHTACGWYE